MESKFQNLLVRKSCDFEIMYHEEHALFKFSVIHVFKVDLVLIWYD